MRLAQSVSLRLGYHKMTQEKFNMDTFYGFWKYLGLSGTFLIGIILTTWGALILTDKLPTMVASVGYIAYILIMPLVVGLVLAWLSFAEFLRIIKEE